ncbi:MAG: protein-glutamate O-methyltransferase CheR [Firmicutes bacterium]|nr:protein-glutamate O-methyltransferase CheR [Bacillota bacterium]
MGETEEGEVTEQVIADLAAVLKMDLAAYKRPQLVRRLFGFARARGIDSLAELARRLRQDAAMGERLRHHLTIHVTSFFRDPAYWQALKTAVTQESPRAHWEVWSAAASTGAEPLSLAWLFYELGLPSQVLATDVDESVLQHARTGVWREDDLEGVPSFVRHQLFEPLPDGRLRVREAFSAAIEYRRLDLLKDPYPNRRFHLIACRNVLIYFREADRLRVVQRLVDCLDDQGLLFLGSTEVLLNPGMFGLATVFPSIYRKTKGVSG